MSAKPDPRRDSTGRWFTVGARVRTTTSPLDKPVTGTVVEFFDKRVRVRWDSGKATSVGPNVLVVLGEGGC